MLAFAALSARALVQCAAAEGLRAVALDVFGDTDTRREAAQWVSIGEPGHLRLDGVLLFDALRGLAGQGAEGWVAGAGFEGRTDLLAEAARVLPLIGTAPEAVARVRDPARFFEALQALGLPHPPVSLHPPAQLEGWLHKDFGGSGGWQVRPARSDDVPGPGVHWQRAMPGTPHSATFIANGQGAVILGFNRQRSRSVIGHPHVFAGVLGPVPMPAQTAASLAAGLDALARRFDLRGLGSLDFLLHEGQAQVLELNPRPPASLALHPLAEGGVLTAHRRACAGGTLPRPAPDGQVRGLEIVYARSARVLHSAQVQAIAGTLGACDLPAEGTQLSPGDPVCTLTAQAPEAAALEQTLAHRRDTLLTQLQTESET